MGCAGKWLAAAGTGPRAMSTSWYYLEDGVTRGPAPHAELLLLFQEQRLPAHTLVWREGMEEWRPAADMGLLPPAAPPEGPRMPPPPPVEPRPAFAGAAAGSIPQQLDRVALGQLAWRRYLARLIDFVLFAMFSGAILSMAFPEQAKTWAEEGNLWLGVVIALAYVPLEAWMLASSGSTPGKRLFAMQVRRRDGSPLDYTTALQRSGWVFVLGQACGAPILTWVVKLLAFGRFQRTGTTLWDQRVGTQVVYGTMTEGRRFAAAALIGLYLALMYLVASSALA